jgi:large subunit ribosomal protein L29
MKAAEIHELSTEELEQKEQELKRNLFNLRFQVATNQQDNTAALGLTRREIARVKTILNERRRKKE